MRASKSWYWSPTELVTCDSVFLGPLPKNCLVCCPFESESESRSVVSDSLWPHGLYSPWNSPGQNTGMIAFPFSRGSSQPRNWTRVSCITGRFFTNWAIREALKYCNTLYFCRKLRLRKTLAAILKVLTPKYDRSLRFSQVYDMKEISYGFLKLYTELEQRFLYFVTFLFIYYSYIHVLCVHFYIYQPFKKILQMTFVQLTFGHIFGRNILNLFT